MLGGEEMGEQDCRFTNRKSAGFFSEELLLQAQKWSRVYLAYRFGCSNSFGYVWPKNGFT
jgi:hypothetical protein